MAFANLFTRLSAVQEGGGRTETRRNDTDDGKRDSGRKKKAQEEQTGPHKKKRCFPAQTSRSSDAASFTRSQRSDMRITDGAGLASEPAHHRRNTWHKGHNYKTTNNVNKQQQRPQHQQKDRWTPASRGGRHQTRPAWRGRGGARKHGNHKQDVPVNRPRFMTEEFKDQNALLVDGRLVCRHFLWGRCIKEDDCQLEHIQGHNDLVKEVCKFYIQGFCTKGESCPFMHKSFPCKFFHRRGKCSQGADCRFSHEPLNDVTNQLLNEALKREADLAELMKKAEQEESGPPEDTDPETAEANKTPGALLQPVRPNFYNSAQPSGDQDASSRQTEDRVEVTEDAASPSNVGHQEPVCYSVAAVLGPQLSKPFPLFFTAAGSGDSLGPRSSSGFPSDSANQIQVPYSVDAVLRSCKSVEKSTFGHTLAPPAAQTVSYSPKTDFIETTDPLLTPETQNEKVSYPANTRKEANASQEKVFKSLSSPRLHTGLISPPCPRVPLVSRVYEIQGGDTPGSPKTAQRAAPEAELEFLYPPVSVAEKSASSRSKGSMHLPTDITCSAKCETEGVLPFGPTNRKSLFSRPPGQTSAPKHPSPWRPHLSVLPVLSQASAKPFCPSSGFAEFKGGAAAPAEPVSSSTETSDSANSAGGHFEIHPHSEKTQSGLKRSTKHHSSPEATAECSSKMAHCGGLAVGCKKTLKTPFHSLFSSPVTDALQPGDDAAKRSSCPLTPPSCPAPPQSADCSGVEPQKASARSFLGLFAAPLQTSSSSSSSSSSQQSNRSHSSDSCSLVSDCLVQTSPGPSPPGSRTSVPRDHQQPSDFSSHRGSAVLKTLFVRLQPYQQDAEPPVRRKTEAAGGVSL